MKLHLARVWYSVKSVIGELFVNGTRECFAIELPELFQGKPNVSRRCCIPPGTYEIELYASPHNHRLVPLLRNVAGRDMIEIHIANRPEELLGCIGVGQTRGQDFIGYSKAAFDRLMSKISAAANAGESIEITISDERRES